MRALSLSLKILLLLMADLSLLCSFFPSAFQFHISPSLKITLIIQSLYLSKVFSPLISLILSPTQSVSSSRIFLLLFPPHTFVFSCALSLSLSLSLFLFFYPFGLLASSLFSSIFTPSSSLSLFLMLLLSLLFLISSSCLPNSCDPSLPLYISLPQFIPSIFSLIPLWITFSVSQKTPRTAQSHFLSCPTLSPSQALFLSLSLSLSLSFSLSHSLCVALILSLLSLSHHLT